MKLKLSVPPLEVTDTEGFSENDMFSQKGFANQLTNIIKNADDELVIGLDSKWGEGKTTFVKMWQGMLLHEENIECIYFDAFKNDYVEDPFLALAAVIYDLVDKKSNKKGKERFKKSAVSAMKVAGKIGINVTAKALTAGVLSANDIFDDSVEEDIVNETTKALDSYLSEKLTGFKKDKKSISDFTDTLKELPELLNSKNNNMVFIIDELDRCRPTFSLELLERIKHIFSVKNIVFVLVMNKVQLEQIIKSKYGEYTDANEYLQKFVNLWATFDNSPIQTSSDSRKLYLNRCLKSIGLDPMPRSIDFATEVYESLVSHYKLTLREIERSISYFSLIINIWGVDLRFEYQIIPTYLCIVRVKYPEVFKRLSEGSIDYKVLVRETNLASFAQQRLGKRVQHPLLVQLLFDLEPEDTRNQLYDEEKYYRDYTLPNCKDVIKDTCKILNSFRSEY